VITCEKSKLDKKRKNTSTEQQQIILVTRQPQHALGHVSWTMMMLKGGSKIIAHARALVSFARGTELVAASISCLVDVLVIANGACAPHWWTSATDGTAAAYCSQ
jgi:hypothetical protein